MSQLFDRISADRARAVRDGADRVAELLGRRGAFLPARAPRLATAERAAALLAALETRDTLELAQTLGTFDPAPSSWPALQRHIQHAAKVARVLGEDVYFNVADALRAATTPEAQALVARFTQALGSDELNVDLAARLPTLSAEGQRVLHPPVVVLASSSASASSRASAQVIVAQETGEGMEALETVRSRAERALAEAGPGARLIFSWQVVKGE